MVSFVVVDGGRARAGDWTVRLIGLPDEGDNNTFPMKMDEPLLAVTFRVEETIQRLLTLNNGSGSGSGTGTGTMSAPKRDALRAHTDGGLHQCRASFATVLDSKA